MVKQSELAEIEDTQKNKYLIFSIGEDLFGIRIRYVTEIINMVSITRVPDQADCMKGIINLRGKIIPIVDLRLKFMKEDVKCDSKTCIIVMEIAGISFGLIIDKVNEVASIQEQYVSGPPVIGIGIDHTGSYLEGVGTKNNQIILLIDCDRLLADTETGGNQNEYEIA
jgi:purine-binding chemotaxis protein CheW